MTLNILTAAQLAAQLGLDIYNGTATQTTIWSETGQAAGCAILNDSTFGLGCPVFAASYTIGNSLFGSSGPLNPVIQGGTVHGIYIPGIADFVNDTILSNPINQAIVQGVKGVGQNIANTWSSISW